MFKNLKSNWRELVALTVIATLLLLGLLVLGLRGVSESGPLSALASLVVTLLSGTVKFCAVLAMAWLATPWTFPKAGKFLLSPRFDSWWKNQTDHGAAIVTLLSVAVLAVIAAICMASA